MKLLVFLLAVTLVAIGCSVKQTSMATQNGKSAEANSAPLSLSEYEYIPDTIPERNNPASLDLSRHQIFIDTTRSSEFYRNLKEWSESKWDTQAINDYLKGMNEGFQPKPVDLKGFPTHFVALRKLHGEFVLYDRCDGIDPRFDIRDTAVIFYGPLESDAETISRLLMLTDNRLELELRTGKERSADQRASLAIERMEGSIYKWIYDGQTTYVTTADKIEAFDLVVNHCPTRKVLEFDGFDQEE